jgi:hypothetical protein
VITETTATIKVIMTTGRETPAEADDLRMMLSPFVDLASGVAAWTAMNRTHQALKYLRLDCHLLLVQQQQFTAQNR